MARAGQQSALFQPPFRKTSSPGDPSEATQLGQQQPLMYSSLTPVETMGRLWGPVTQPKRRIKPWSQWRIWTFTCGPEHTRNRRRTSCPASRKPLKSGGLASRANREPISALAGLEASGIARPCSRSTIETICAGRRRIFAAQHHPVFGGARASTPPSAPKALLTTFNAAGPYPTSIRPRSARFRQRGRAVRGETTLTAPESSPETNFAAEAN